MAFFNVRVALKIFSCSDWIHISAGALVKRCARVVFSHYHQAPILATVLCNTIQTILNSSDTPNQSVENKTICIIRGLLFLKKMLRI